MAYPLVAPFIQKELGDMRDPVRRVVTATTGYSLRNKDWALDRIIPFYASRLTYTLRRKLDSRLGHTQALGRNSLTAWLAEIGDLAITTNGFDLTSMTPAKANGYLDQYSQAKSGYSAAYNSGATATGPNDSFDINPATTTGQRFWASTAIHVGTALGRRLLVRTGAGKYLSQGLSMFAGKGRVSL